MLLKPRGKNIVRAATDARVELAMGAREHQHRRASMLAFIVASAAVITNAVAAAAKRDAVEQLHVRHFRGCWS